MEKKTTTPDNNNNSPMFASLSDMFSEHLNLKLESETYPKLEKEDNKNTLYKQKTTQEMVSKIVLKKKKE